MAGGYRSVGAQGRAGGLASKARKRLLVGGELRKELVACLRQSRKHRRPRARGEDRRDKIPNMVSIHERPAEVDERLVLGHWEGDLIKGACNASAVGTLVERTSLFVTLAKMDNASAEAAEKGIGFVLSRIDAQR